MNVDAGYTRTGGFYGRYNTSSNELKFFDTGFSAFTIDTSGDVMGSLNLIPQGVTESTRIGRQCIVKGLYMKGWLQWQNNYAQSLYADAIVRFVLVWDTQANGANPLWTDVFEGNASAISFRNLENVQRFKILKEWVITPRVTASNTSDAWATAGNGLANSAPVVLKYNNSKLHIPLEFSSTTGAITEIKSNNLVLLAYSNAGDDVNKVTMNWRLRFQG